MRSDPVLALSYELSELVDRDTYLHAAGVSLNALLPGDDTFWLETDFGRRTASASHGPAGTADPVLGRLLADAHDHPAVRSYLDDPGDLTPRRLSDVIADLAWRRSHTHDLLAGPMGRHQLSLIVRLEPPDQGHGWTIGRSGPDFTDAELELAGRLLPLLTTLDRLYARLLARSTSTPATSTSTPSTSTLPSALTSLTSLTSPTTATLQARERSRLTPREVDILTLIGDGLTAVAIGHLRRLSSATVRKHLEHVYAKLGYHDRLLAVQEARRLELLPPLVIHRAP